MTDRRTFLAAAAGVALLPLAAAQAQTRSTRIRTKDSTEIHVKEWNRSGRPVIFTHAWPLSADIWDAQALALSNAGYRVVSYDRRGFGRSGKPASGYDFDTFADDLAVLIRDLNLQDAALVGYSMGGGEVVRYFSRHGGVVVKSVAATPFLSFRRSYDGMDEVVPMVRAIAEEGARQVRPTLRDKLMVVAHNDGDDERLDLEIGFSLARASNASVRISGSCLLLASELPAAPTMATIVRAGTNAASHSSFAAIGTWIEANDYAIAGPSREVFLESITEPPGFEAALVEIQFPVRPHTRRAR